MPKIRIPGPEGRRAIESGVAADIRMCWTCGSCDFECPVDIATGRLRPQKIVRMAALGLLDDLMHLPEVWYCIQCRRCTQICPNSVQPEPLIGWLRRQALAAGVIDRRSVPALRDLYCSFQRIRWHAAAFCRQHELEEIDSARWLHWMRKPVTDPASGPIPLAADRKPPEVPHRSNRVSLCFTCGECSSACPVSVSRRIFDPRYLLRMASLGMGGALLRSPSIWLCISCGRCTQVCTQTVKCCEAIAEMRQRAVDSGRLDAGFVHRLQRADRLLYARLLDEIDACLGRENEEAGAADRRHAR